MAFLSASEMNTDLAKRLKAIFDKSLERKYAAAAAKKKEKKSDDSASDDASDHVDPIDPPKGVLGKDGEYAQRGCEYVRSKDGRGVYRNFDHPHLDEIRELVRKVAEFPGGPTQNFNPKAKNLKTGGTVGQREPYVWEGHHILPGSAFYYESEGAGSGPAFTYKQYRLILQSDYNLNHGHNIIMLPKESWAVPVHTLLQHPGDHPQYTQRVMASMKEISQRLQEQIDQEKPHKDLEVAIFNELKDLEEEYWDFIVNLSRLVVAEVAQGRRYVHDHVRYAPEKGKSTYDWGALF